MLLSLLISFILISNCKAEMGTNNDDATNLSLKYIRSALEGINSLLENIHFKMKNSLDIVNKLTNPTSEPPDFIENYSINDITAKSSNEFTSNNFEWYFSSTTKKEEGPWNKIPNDLLTTVKLPTHPFYTFTFTTDTTPSTEHTYFWEEFVGDGVDDSKELLTGSAEIESTTEINSRFKSLRAEKKRAFRRANEKGSRIEERELTNRMGQKAVIGTHIITLRPKCTRTFSTSKHLQITSPCNMTESAFTKPSTSKRYTRLNYKRDFNFQTANPRKHKFKWSWIENMASRAVP